MMKLAELEEKTPIISQALKEQGSKNSGHRSCVIRLMRTER